MIPDIQKFSLIFFSIVEKLSGDYLYIPAVIKFTKNKVIQCTMNTNRIVSLSYVPFKIFIIDVMNTYFWRLLYPCSEIFLMSSYFAFLNIQTNIKLRIQFLVIDGEKIIFSQLYAMNWKELEPKD